MTPSRSEIDSTFSSSSLLSELAELSKLSDASIDPFALMTDALKEWAIAVEALAAGETVVLLRKGGIREAKFLETNGLGDRSQVWLYPTYEHQKPELLKPNYRDRVVAVPSGWHPETVPIQAWAKITHGFELTEPAQVAALEPFHVWNDAFVEMRLKWKPRSPMTVLLLRVFRLEQPVNIPFEASYGGCRSWITLQDQIAASPAVPALSDESYGAIVHDILANLTI